MTGYELAEEVFSRIGKNQNHEISYEDMIRVISFWGFNEESDRTNSNKIGFVCYCARQKIKKIFEQALVWGNFEMYNELKKCMDNFEVEDKLCENCKYEEYNLNTEPCVSCDHDLDNWEPKEDQNADSN